MGGGGGGGSKNSQTTPATTSTSSIRQLLGAADAQTAHPATFSTAPTHQLLGSANAETTPARAPAAAADKSSDPTQHAKGRTGDCPGPRKEATTRRTVTQGGVLLLEWAAVLNNPFGGGGEIQNVLLRPPAPFPIPLELINIRCNVPQKSEVGEAVLWPGAQGEGG